jgi:N-methylhydantoinase A/oxoprolinase/acetone carboxylase beta subunit
VYWPGLAEFVETDVYDERVLSPDAAIAGPAVIQLPDTTVAIRPHQRATVDEYLNVVIQED